MLQTEDQSNTEADENVNWIDALLEQAERVRIFKNMIFILGLKIPVFPLPHRLLLLCADPAIFIAFQKK